MVSGKLGYLTFVLLPVVSSVLTIDSALVRLYLGSAMPIEERASSFFFILRDLREVDTAVSLQIQRSHGVKPCYVFLCLLLKISQSQ